MKKLLIIGLAFAVMFSLCSCAANNTDVNIKGFVPFHTSQYLLFNNCKSNYYVIFDNAEFIFDGRIVYNNYGTDGGEYPVYGDNSKKGTYILYDPDYNVEFYEFDEKSNTLFFMDTDNSIFYRMLIHFGDTVTAEEPVAIYQGSAVPIQSDVDALVLETEKGYLSFDTQTGETMDYLESKIPETYREHIKILPDEAINIADKYMKSRTHNGDEEYPLDEYEPVLDVLSCQLLLFPEFDSPNFEGYWSKKPEYCWCIVYSFGYEEDIPAGGRAVYINAADGSLFGTSFSLAD